MTSFRVNNRQISEIGFQRYFTAKSPKWQSKYSKMVAGLKDVLATLLVIVVVVIEV